MSSWGSLSQEEVNECLKAPAGEAAKIIRKHDPAWGLSGSQVFELHFVKKVTEYHNCKVKVAAENEEAANEIAKGMLKNRYKDNSPISFEYFADTEDEEIYLEEIEKAE